MTKGINDDEQQISGFITETRKSFNQDGLDEFTANPFNHKLLILLKLDAGLKLTFS